MTVNFLRFIVLLCILSGLQCIVADACYSAELIDPATNTEPSEAATSKEKTSKAKSNKSKTDEKKPNRRSVDPDLERNVLQMVDRHLPDVKILLDQLRKKNPTQYAAAVRNLAKSARRLQLAKKRSEEAFELEVEVVKAQSSINLLVAKLRIKDNEKDRKALRAATHQSHQAELARDRQEFAVWQDRLQKMQQQVNAIKKGIAEMETHSTQRVETSFKANLRKAGIKD